jgi:hypothetical protein
VVMSSSARMGIITDHTLSRFIIRGCVSRLQGELLLDSWGLSRRPADKHVYPHLSQASSWRNSRPFTVSTMTLEASSSPRTNRSRSGS